MTKDLDVNNLGFIPNWREMIQFVKKNKNKKLFWWPQGLKKSQVEAGRPLGRLPQFFR